MSRALGRRVPSDFKHVERYPLTAETAPTKPVPVVIGVNWYTAFDQPQKASDGHWWIARHGGLGTIRGGHCVCLKPRGASDPTSWWDFYNQQSEGICVGEGCSRMSSLNNRVRYQPRWLYDRCKERDGAPNEEGTEVRVGLEVLKDLGHVRALNGEQENLTPGAITRQPNAQDGIAAYRWATSTDDALAALGYGGLDYVDVVNSWGRDYPHLVRMPSNVLDRLRREDGEIGIPTDR